MKEIVRKIFGNEAAEDADIVAFYEDVQKLAMEEYAAEWKSKYEALKVQSTRLADSADSFAKISEWGINEIAKKYDELKAENERWVKMYKAQVESFADFQTKYAAQKEKADKLLGEVNRAYGTLIGGTPKDRADTLNILNQATCAYSNKEVDNDPPPIN